MKNIKNFSDYILESKKNNIFKILLNSTVFESYKSKGENIFTLDNGGKPFI